MADSGGEFTGKCTGFLERQVEFQSQRTDDSLLAEDLLVHMRGWHKKRAAA